MSRIRTLRDAEASRLPVGAAIQVAPYTRFVHTRSGWETRHGAIPKHSNLIVLVHPDGRRCQVGGSTIDLFLADGYEIAGSYLTPDMVMPIGPHILRADEVAHDHRLAVLAEREEAFLAALQALCEEHQMKLVARVNTVSTCEDNCTAGLFAVHRDSPDFCFCDADDTGCGINIGMTESYETWARFPRDADDGDEDA